MTKNSIQLFSIDIYNQKRNNTHVSVTLTLPKRGWMDMKNTSEFESNTCVHTYHYPRLHVHGGLCGCYWSPSSPAVHSERSPRSRGCWSWSRISSLPRSLTSHTPVITEPSHVSKWMVPLNMHQLHDPSLSTVHPDFKQRMILTFFYSQIINYLLVR